MEEKNKPKFWELNISGLKKWKNIEFVVNILQEIHKNKQEQSKLEKIVRPLNIWLNLNAKNVS